MRQVADLGDGGPHVGGDLVEDLGGGRPVLRLAREQLPRQAEVHGERHQVLLGTVVDVALDPPALGVGGGDEPQARGAQLLVGPPEVVQAGPKRCVEAAVVQHDSEPTADLAEGALVVGADPFAFAGLLDDECAEQVAAVAHGGDPHLRVAPADEQLRQPQGEPGLPGDTGPSEHGAVLGTERRRRARPVRHREQPRDAGVVTGPHLDAVHAERRAQRLGELPEQLVERHVAGAVAEGLQDRLRAAPQPDGRAPGRPDDRRPERPERQGGDGGADQRGHHDRPLVGVWQPAHHQDGDHQGEQDSGTERRHGGRGGEDPAGFATYARQEAGERARC